MVFARTAKRTRRRDCVGAHADTGQRRPLPATAAALRRRCSLRYPSQNVLHFIQYATASNTPPVAVVGGVADGMVPSDIGVAENGNTPTDSVRQTLAAFPLRIVVFLLICSHRSSHSRYKRKAQLKPIRLVHKR